VFEQEIKEQENENKTEAPVESVKIAAPSTLILDGKIDEKEQRRLQALVGTGKSDNIKVFAGKTGEKLVITKAHVKASQAIVFSGCNNCEYNIQAYCVKVFVESCKGLILRVNEKSSQVRSKSIAATISTASWAPRSVVSVWNRARR
jgi:hypothetical protein